MEMVAAAPRAKKRKSEQSETPESEDVLAEEKKTASTTSAGSRMRCSARSSRSSPPRTAPAPKSSPPGGATSGAPLLNLDSGSLCAHGEALSGVISRVLAAHQGPGRCFRVSALHIHLRAATVDAWLRSPALDNLEELDFSDSPEYVPMRLQLRLPLPPASTFRFASTLRVATIGHLHLPDDITQTLRFPLLKKLALQSVSILEGSLHGLIAGCHALESLLLDRSYGFRCVRINSASLRCIGVRTYYYYQGVVGLQEVLIEDAPCLEKFLYLKWRMGLQVSVIVAPKLETVGCISDFSSSFRLALGSAIIQWYQRSEESLAS